MNSAAVHKKLGLDADSWKRFPHGNHMVAPSSTGVYVFRFAGGREIGRVYGTSDIIYVGSGKLRGRLRAHANPDWEHWDDSGWLIAFILMGMEAEVAWLELPLDQAQARESDLLGLYLLDHSELPPANRKTPNLSPLQEAWIALKSLSTADKRKLFEKARNTWPSILDKNRWDELLRSVK